MMDANDNLEILYMLSWLAVWFLDLVNKSPTDLQISLTVAVRRNKSLIPFLHKSSVQCMLLLWLRDFVQESVSSCVDGRRVGTNQIYWQQCVEWTTLTSSQNCKTFCHSWSSLKLKILSGKTWQQVVVKHLCTRICGIDNTKSLKSFMTSPRIPNYTKEALSQA